MHSSRAGRGGGIRTRTGGILSPLPLPLGYSPGLTVPAGLRPATGTARLDGARAADDPRGMLPAAKSWFAAGALLVGTGVGLAAWHAHGLAASLED